MEFIDARELPPGRRLDADLCIVGAGAAGLALAQALEGSGRDVLLLESGGLERDAELQ
jgi:flavin-dependent dehydrogenase